MYHMPLFIVLALSFLSSCPSPSNITFLPCTCFESHRIPTHHGSTKILCCGYYKPSYENSGPPRGAQTQILRTTPLLTCAPLSCWILPTKHKFQDKLLRISRWQQEGIKPAHETLLSVAPYVTDPNACT